MTKLIQRYDPGNRIKMIGYEGKKYICYFWFVGWWAFSLGIHIDVKSPNIELHIPFGFIRIGKKHAPSIAIRRVR